MLATEVLTSIFLSSPPQITFYEGKCFSGRKLEVCGTCSSFQQRGFPHRVNSIRVQSGAWVCFDHPELHGQQFVLEHGEYPHWQRWNGRGDRMGSCRPVGMVSRGTAVCIPGGARVGLGSLQLRCSAEMGAQVSRCCSLCYGMRPECSDCSFSCLLISPGDISECSGGCHSLWVLFLVVLLTRPRCSQHGQHYRIQLFEGSCFGGRSMELTEDCSCLRGRGWEQPHVNAVRVYGDGA